MFTIKEFMALNGIEGDTLNPTITIPIAKGLKAEGYECHLVRGPDGWTRRYWGKPEEFQGRTRRPISMEGMKIPGKVE